MGSQQKTEEGAKKKKAHAQVLVAAGAGPNETQGGCSGSLKLAIYLYLMRHTSSALLSYCPKPLSHFEFVVQSNRARYQISDQRTDNRQLTTTE